jgi:hypothetical protein
MGGGGCITLRILDLESCFYVTTEFITTAWRLSTNRETKERAMFTHWTR